MNLLQLSEATGVSPRNIKRYIHERLLAPPEGRTRSARYSEVHRRCLVRIESLRAAGLSKDQIREELQPHHASDRELSRGQFTSDLAPLIERRYPIADGVFVVFATQSDTQDLDAQTVFARRCKAILAP